MHTYLPWHMAAREDEAELTIMTTEQDIQLRRHNRGPDHPLPHPHPHPRRPPHAHPRRNPTRQFHPLRPVVNHTDRIGDPTLRRR